MPTCVYCRSTSSKRFPAEHVIPKSFGRFRTGLTVHCVCDACNQFFANNLELYFARETGESIVRFQYGLMDKTAGHPGSRLTVRVKAPGPIFGAKVLLAPNAQANGMEIIYMPQVGFAEENSEDWVGYLWEELNSEIIRALKPGSRVQYFRTSPAEEEHFRTRLRELDFPATQHIRTDTILPQPEMPALRLRHNYPALCRQNRLQLFGLRGVGRPAIAATRGLRCGSELRKAWHARGTHHRGCYREPEVDRREQERLAG